MPCTKNDDSNAALAVAGLGLMLISYPLGTALCKDGNDGSDCGASSWAGPGLFFSGAVLFATGLARKVYGKSVPNVIDQEQGREPLIDTNEDARNNQGPSVIP